MTYNISNKQLKAATYHKPRHQLACHMNLYAALLVTSSPGSQQNLQQSTLAINRLAQKCVQKSHSKKSTELKHHISCIAQIVQSKQIGSPVFVSFK